MHAALVRARANNKPSQMNWKGRQNECLRGLLDANHVACLEALGPFQQVKLDGLAFVQGPVSILLNGGKMNENVLARGSLNEAISLRPVKPLYCSLLSHKKLLSLLFKISAIFGKAVDWCDPAKLSVARCSALRFFFET